MVNKIIAQDPPPRRLLVYNMLYRTCQLNRRLLDFNVTRLYLSVCLIFSFEFDSTNYVTMIQASESSLPMEYLSIKTYSLPFKFVNEDVALSVKAGRLLALPI